MLQLSVVGSARTVAATSAHAPPDDILLVMITSTAVPVEEYLRTTYDPDMEYVDGQLVERHVGEYDHSRLQSLIVIELGARQRERRFRIFTEQRVRVSDARPDTEFPMSASRRFRTGRHPFSSGPTW